jgi:hypothetical protein
MRMVARLAAVLVVMLAAALLATGQTLTLLSAD